MDREEDLHKILEELQAEDEKKFEDKVYLDIKQTNEKIVLDEIKKYKKLKDLKGTKYFVFYKDSESGDLYYHTDVKRDFENDIVDADFDVKTDLNKGLNIKEAVCLFNEIEYKLLLEINYSLIGIMSLENDDIIFLQKS